MKEEEIFAAGETKQRTEPRHMHLPCRLLELLLALSSATKSLHFPASVRGSPDTRDPTSEPGTEIAAIIRPLIRRLPRGIFVFFILEQLHRVLS